MVFKFYSKYRIELSCIWSIKFFIFRKRYSLFLCSVNSLSGISHLSKDILLLIFRPWTPTVDYHQLQPLSVKQTFEKIRRANKKKHQKVHVFYVDTSAMNKSYFVLFHPTTNISKPPSFLEFGKSLSSSTTATFKRDGLQYTS